VYGVRFTAVELFGHGDHTITIDLWQSYLSGVAEPESAETAEAEETT
jgi:hypothetical protein